MQHAMTIPKHPNRRTDNRLNVCLKVEVTFTDGRQYTCCTRDMSTTGLFLEYGNNEQPEIGSIVQVKVASDLGMPDAPLVKAEVVRLTDEGYGIMFLTP